MRCHVYSNRTGDLLRVEEGEPQCGHDFCDRCGDCLHCYQDGCYQGGEWVVGASCLWAKYENDPAEPK